ncbi:hypothetical protein HNR46_002114 [Haloferula luteola]|uniref:Uncharacterized protein n=1 Tax=Haloferula luteola TaxID=595692 RepID=A0A840V1K7_9BACT|nr:hypothetical protein [Haloferula luteola]MBB5351875.1 hypothetical protein [Haloferula luteola]
MARLLMLVSLMTLIAAAVARWWFWGRIRDQGRRIPCEMSVAELGNALGVPAGRSGELRDAAALGSALREAGLKLMEMEGIAEAKRRRIGWWNLRILPALVAVVLVFSAVSRWAPFAWVLAVGMLVMAGHVAVRMSGVGVELEAVKRGHMELRKKVRLRRVDEEEAILRCARASVWETIFPW